MMLTAAAAVCAMVLSAAQIHDIDATVSGVLQRQHIPGMSVGIARGDSPLYERGYGVRNIASGAATDAATVYEIGSLTKQFTAAAILLAHEDGVLDLQAPLADYVPEYGNGASVTVQQLLDQTSGIPDFANDPGFDSWMNSEQTPAEILARVAGAPLRFVPGSQFDYSNTNYLLLGMILERVTRHSYADFLNTRLLVPLHLSATRYTDLSLRGPDYAAGYAWRDGAFAPFESRAMSVPYSAGALSSNVPDLLSWEAALFSGRAVAPAAAKLMTETPGYAFGLLHHRIYGRDVVDHNGNLPGYSAYAAVLPRTNLTIVLLANTNTDLNPLGKSLIGIVAPQLDGGEDPAVTARVALAVAPIEALRAYGSAVSFTFLDHRQNASASAVRYRIVFEHATVTATFSVSASGEVTLLRYEPAA